MTGINKKPLRLSARTRIECLADSFRELDEAMVPRDMLGFLGYPDKLQDAQDRTGENDAVVTGVASIHSCRCVLIVMEPGFLMGSMGVVAGEKITRAFDTASRKKLPVVSIAVSGGARMQEGTYSLMQMAKTAAAVARHSQKGLFYLSVIADPTMGGVTASFASLGDIILALSGARFGFTGKRIVEETTRETLPPDFQTAEYAKSHGLVDGLVNESNLRDVVGRMLYLHKRK